MASNAALMSGEDENSHLTFEERAKAKGMKYTINEVPPLSTSIMLGLQQCLIMLVGTVISPLIYGPAMGANQAQLGQMSSTIMFVSGINTLIQTTFGDRLPIVQGGSFSFFPAIFSIIFNPELQAITDDNERFLTTMGVVQGSVLVVGVVQILLGYTGIVVPMLRFIGPVTVAPVIATIGLGLYNLGFADVATCFPMGLMQLGVTIFFGQYLKKFKIAGQPLFALFPIALSILLTWGLFGILTASDVFGEESQCRTDASRQFIQDTQWFRIPYPGQWGPLLFRGYGIIPMLGSMMASMCESIGDYYSCARLSGAPPPTPGIVSRGLANEGIGVALAGLFGTGTGTTSYSENIAALALTGVGSRVVIQVAGICMILVSLFSKATMALASMPPAMVGGIYCTVFGMIIAVGFSSLQYIDLNSERNLFVVGFALFSALSIAGPSGYFNSLDGENPFGTTDLAQVALSIFGSPMIIALIASCLLDNLIRGTRDERGLTVWDKVKMADIHNDPEYVATYSLPSFFSKLFHNCGYLEYASQGKFPEPPVNGFQAGRGGIGDLCCPCFSSDDDDDSFDDHPVPKRVDQQDETSVKKDVPQADQPMKKLIISEETDC